MMMRVMRVMMTMRAVIRGGYLAVGHARVVVSGHQIIPLILSKHGKDKG